MILFILPGGRVVDIQPDVARDHTVIDFTLKGGVVVKALRVPMDEYTVGHFHLWVLSVFREPGQRERAIQKMIGVFMQDAPRYYMEGWPVLLRDTEAEHGISFDW